MRAQEGDALADALSAAKVSSLCGCPESDCFTFSTHATNGAEYDESIPVEDAPGLVVLDVGPDRELLGVEILGWGALGSSYRDFRERIRQWP